MHSRGTMHLGINRFSAVAVVLTGLASLVGCKDQEKCTEALQTARQAMQDEYLDMALARQWREHAGKICGVGPELETLDREILERESALAKAAEEKAKAEADAGRAAIEESKSLWGGYDELEKADKDLKALKKTYSASKKLVVGLVPVYAEQVKAYNEKQYERRKAKFDKK